MGIYLVKYRDFTLDTVELSADEMTQLRLKIAGSKTKFTKIDDFSGLYLDQGCLFPRKEAN